MDPVVTDDKSVTFFSAEFKEHYHSTIGALRESREKYILPILDKIDLSSQDEIVILDYCFGLGYNTFSALTELRLRFSNKPIRVIGLENDINILKKLDVVCNYYNGIVADLVMALHHAVMFGGDAFRVEDGGISIELYIGDARKTINFCSSFSFDIVLFDPFSPKVCPELWDVLVFRKIYELLSSPSVLATYSCARAVRDALAAAGFVVIDGPCVGRRSPSTLALKK